LKIFLRGKRKQNKVTWLLSKEEKKCFELQSTRQSAVVVSFPKFASFMQPTSKAAILQTHSLVIKTTSQRKQKSLGNKESEVSPFLLREAPFLTPFCP
jgi:hypothetical protein